MEPQEENFGAKTYKPLLLWFVLFLSFSIACPLILTKLFTITNPLLTRITLIDMLLGVDVLLYIILKGQYVYWINGGPTYEKAKEGGALRRRTYAKAHLVLFLKTSLICLVWLGISYALHLSQWIDIAVVSVAVVTAAILSVKIKF